MWAGVSSVWWWFTSSTANSSCWSNSFHLRVHICRWQQCDVFQTSLSCWRWCEFQTWLMWWYRRSDCRDGWRWRLWWRGRWKFMLRRRGEVFFFQENGKSDFSCGSVWLWWEQCLFVMRAMFVCDDSNVCLWWQQCLFVMTAMFVCDDSNVCLWWEQCLFVMRAMFVCDESNVCLWWEQCLFVMTTMFGNKVSGQRPGSAMPWKTLEKVRARTCGTKSPKRSKALRSIDSAKSPSTNRWGFGWVDKAQCFRSLRRFGAAGSSPDFSRVFHGMALPGLCLETLFPCTILSYPGQLPPLTTMFVCDDSDICWQWQQCLFVIQQCLFGEIAMLHVRGDIREREKRFEKHGHGTITQQPNGKNWKAWQWDNYSAA